MSITLGQFELLEPLGSGRTSAVFHSIDPESGLPVAIKLIHEQVALAQPDYVANLMGEARKSATLRHTGLLKVHLADVSGGQYFITSELLEGNTLERIISIQQPMEEAAVLSFGGQIARALRAAQAAHLMHGDIKPRNIFITTTGSAKLLDFGLSKGAAIENVPEEDGSIAQSAFYIAPEREGKEAVDFHSDIYSLGAVLFFALTGRPPLQADSLEELAAKRKNEVPPPLRSLNAQISSQAERLVARMLEKNVSKRYQDYDFLIAGFSSAEKKLTDKFSVPVVGGVVPQAKLKPPKATPANATPKAVLHQPRPQVPKALTTPQPGSKKMALILGCGAVLLTAGIIAAFLSNSATKSNVSETAPTETLATSGTIIGDPADARVNRDLTVSDGTTKFCDVGTGRIVVHIFQIPPAVLSDPTQQFSTASYAIRIGTSSNTVNADLYGLPFTTTPTISGSAFYEGASDHNNALIQNNFLTPAIPNYSGASTSNIALVSYLNKSLAAARAAGAATAYVSLRVNCDTAIETGRYLTGMSEADDPYKPTLAYKTVRNP